MTYKIPDDLTSEERESVLPFFVNLGNEDSWYKIQRTLILIGMAGPHSVSCPDGGGLLQYVMLPGNLAVLRCDSTWSSSAQTRKFDHFRVFRLRSEPRHPIEF